MSEEPKTITVTIEQLVAFASKVEASTDYDGCLSSYTAEELVAEFFGIEVPAPPKPEPAPLVAAHKAAVAHRFGSAEDKMFRELISGFTDEMVKAQLVKR